MAYEEYLDYISRAKTTGKYILYTLDGVGESRKNSPELFVFKTPDDPFDEKYNTINDECYNESFSRQYWISKKTNMEAFG